MEGSTKKMRIDLDKLPIKRLEAIEEAGTEHFPSETGDEETRLNMIRRIDFSSIVETDANKKAKKSSTKEAAPAPAWPWQSLVENLQSAHQELSVIIDLINTVEANDAVTVAWMQRPKQLPNEVLSDLAVSAATKLQRLRHLGRYFKQSSKALEQQVAREARFYGSLIRLQQNWKVKRQRLALTGPGSEGFTIDLLDNSMAEMTPLGHTYSLSTVRVDEDSAGILAVQRPLKSCHSLRVGFLGANSSRKPRNFIRRKQNHSVGHLPEVKKDALTEENVNECIKETHSTLREIHQSIFQEQVFDMVNRETFNPSPGVNMTGMREDFLQLAIGQDTSLCLHLVPSEREDDSEITDPTGHTKNGESGISCPESLELMIIDEKSDPHKRSSLVTPNPLSLEVHLLHLFQENILSKAKERQSLPSRLQVSGHPVGDKSSLLGHFCMTVSHRIFSKKVLLVLEHLVHRVPYLQLLSHPTWNSRISSWSLYVKVPQSIMHSSRQNRPSNDHNVKSGIRSQFHTKVVVNDDKITISAEGVPSVISSFCGSSSNLCSINCYGCDMVDLPMILLQQVASQVIYWLHEEALAVGMKARRDYLCLYFNLDLGETLGLVAHIDPDDAQGCISWFVVLDHGSMEEPLSAKSDGPEYRRFLGHLTLEALYSTLMDLVGLCSTGGSH